MQKRGASQQWFGLIVWVAVSFLPAATAMFVNTGSWYAQLEKPTWTPPSWVFGPVWTLLYFLMGLSALRVWKKHGFAHARTALLTYLFHLILNAAWTLIFFGLHMITLAGVEITVLWLMIAWLVVLFFRHDRAAGVMLVPYLLWVTYASTLNVGFMLLNE